MIIKDLAEAAEFISGDHARLRELLNPRKEPVALRYSLAHALVPAGRTTKRHRLRTSEVYYILQGSGRMHVDEESAPVKAHQAVYIPPGAVQWIENIGSGPLLFLCIVDPAWRLEDEAVLE
jgi:mannose-6-phosphate isomerase-like protein (cupin superfamily)